MSDTAMNTVHNTFDENDPTHEHSNDHGAHTKQKKNSPGAMLATEREAQSLTIEQVAAHLNLAPRQILALEEDNFDALPGMASVRGFIRSYAKLLKLEVNPLLAMVKLQPVAVVRESLSTRRAIPTPFADGSRLPTLGEPKSSSNLLRGVALIAIIGVVAVAYKMGWVPPLKDFDADRFGVAATSVVPTSAITTASAPAVVAEPTTTEILNNTTANTTANATENTAGNLVANPATNASVISVPTASAAAEVAPAPKSTPTTDALAKATLSTNDKQQAVVQVPATLPSPSLTATHAVGVVAKNSLLIKPQEDSWIEIKSNIVKGAKGVLLSRVVKAGETESVELDEPVTVIVGNAKGVSMTLRGSPVDLKTDMKNNVARLQLK